MKIVLTGSSGFLGTHLLDALKNYDIYVLGRRCPPSISDKRFLMGTIDASSNYTSILNGGDVLIHCAARVHIMKDSSCEPLQAFRDVNTLGTLNLARQAAEAGAKRFIFISSVKVNGESTQSNRSFTCFDQRLPEDPYGQSKSEAEVQLLALSEKTGMEVVIIRPPLVYGPGVKANFASLMNLVSKGLPLPFGLITANKRSLVSVTNLVDLIVTCIDHPKASNQVFLVSDDQNLSTAGMIHCMSKGLGTSGRMLPVPVWCYSLVGKLLGKQDVVTRLIGSLQVDITHTKETLNWKPPQTVQDAFEETAQAFIQSKVKRINK